MKNSEDNIMNGRDDRDKLDPSKITHVKKYTVIDLVKSRRLFVTSLIMWLAW